MPRARRQLPRFDVTLMEQFLDDQRGLKSEVYELFRQVGLCSLEALYFYCAGRHVAVHVCLPLLLPCWRPLYRQCQGRATAQCSCRVACNGAPSAHSLHPAAPGAAGGGGGRADQGWGSLHAGPAAVPWAAWQSCSMPCSACLVLDTPCLPCPTVAAHPACSLLQRSTASSCGAACEPAVLSGSAVRMPANHATPYMHWPKHGGRRPRCPTAPCPRLCPTAPPLPALPPSPLALPPAGAPSSMPATLP